MNKNRKVITSLLGTVISDINDKTVTIEVGRSFQHPLYKKIVRKKKKYLAHDEQNKCKNGDKVRIKQIRPMSKRKKWMVYEILTANKTAEVKNDTDAD